jgi:L-rhamnose mutarotase
MLTRAVLAIDLKDDPAAIEAYRTHHARIWPEVAASLRRSGIRQMEIFLIGRRLVMVVESDGRDLERAFAEHHASTDARVLEWERLMKSMQVPVPGAAPAEWWARMERVFQLVPTE